MRAVVAAFVSVVVGLLSQPLLCGPAWAGPIAPSSVGGPLLVDADLVSGETLVAGTEATVWLRLSSTRGPGHSQPLGQQPLSLTLRKAAGHKALLTRALRTDDDGTLAARFRVPPLPEGLYLLEASGQALGTTFSVTQPVRLTDALVLRLATDRGVYAPGQRLHWRVTALHGVDARPRDGLRGRLTIADPRGTAIWRGEVEPDDTGMVQGELPLSEDLLTGPYKLSLELGGATVHETIDVRHFELPPFTVSFALHEPGPFAPGDTVTGEAAARYSYGEPVSGLAVLSLGTRRVQARLDAWGHATFSFQIPADASGRLRVDAEVTDGARRRQTAHHPLLVMSDTLQVVCVPELRRPRAGEPVVLTVLSTDGEGGFVPAELSVRLGDGPWRPVGPSPGARQLWLDTEESITVRAVAGQRSGEASLNLSRAAANAPSLRLAEAVVGAGQPVVLSGALPGIPGALLLATLERSGTAIASQVVSADAEGRFLGALSPPPGAFGLASVQVTRVGWEAATGRVRAEAVASNVYLLPARLDVEIEGAGRFRPGDAASLRARVSDADGQPVAGASVAASVVDERALALSEPRPDLVEVLRSLDMAGARAAGLHFAALLQRIDGLGPDESDAATAASLALRALVEALEVTTRLPLVQLAAAERRRAELQRMQRVWEAVWDTLKEDPEPMMVRAGEGWQPRERLDDVLARAGWEEAERATPWSEPTSWGYLQAVRPELTAERMAVEITTQRVGELVERLREQQKRTRRVLLKSGTEGLSGLAGRRVVPRWMAVDPWGHPIQVVVSPGSGSGSSRQVALVSVGPDGELGGGDDHRVDDIYGPGGAAGFGMHGVGMGGGGGVGFASLRGAGGIRAMVGGPAARLRERFDETVLWAAGLKTGPRGEVPLEVALADSVTGWSVEVEAVSPLGAVGVQTARLETFMPLFAEVKSPRELTVGDRYAIPVVLANHSGAERVLTARLSVEGALALDGPSTAELSLGSGTTGLVSFPVLAASVGEARVTVRLLDASGEVDASRRVVQVEGAGKQVRRLLSSRVDAGAGQLAFTVPPNVEPGTLDGYLRLFRGARDQALDGLEGMLREPHGCFEQTSSTTYPNLLVLELLGKEPGQAQAVSRATELVAKGYQRLISYEVSGGGFSWFGEAPANKALTAYGLLEFVDMARVYPVDPNLISRTRRWLVGEQERDGSWRPDKSWLHDWSAVSGQATITAWVVWALAESGERGPALDKGLRWLGRHRSVVAKDPYALALWAAAEARVAPEGRSSARSLAALLQRSSREGDGLRVSAGERTLFYAKGQGADVQVTALSAMALSAGSRAADAQAALGWLWQARSPSQGWGTTQGTVLALRAAARAGGGAADEGVLTARLDGGGGSAMDLASVDLPTAHLPDSVGAGEHVWTLSGDVEGAVEAELRLRWREQSPPEPETAGLTVELTTPASPTPIGESGSFLLALHNPGSLVIPMPTAVVPIPPGFRAVPSSLAALKSLPQVSQVEDHGSALNIYLERLDPGESAALPYQLEATAACDVSQRPARAYAYYDPETRGSTGASRILAIPRPLTAARASQP